jgi:tetratricopeptide (TPR) repeat protein
MDAGSAELKHGYPGARLLAVERLLQTDERDRGLQELRGLEGTAVHDGRVLQGVGRIYSHLNLHVDAERCYARAAALSPGEPQALYNWATCLTALGQLEAAELRLNQVVALAPDDHDAQYNRSILRRQSLERNHVDELRQAWSDWRRTPTARIALGYALAKELEDLQRYSESFAALKAAADMRRRLLSYRVEHDVATMAQIAQAFDADYCRRPVHSGSRSVRPIFIVGLPRSGTTLVDRILSSHSQVASRGESSDLAAILMRLAGAVPDRRTLVQRATALDAAHLGRSFCARLPRTGAPQVIDKTPLNFLYLGLIAGAMPDAAIIHVRRHPLDVCYAMYKTLFRMAYPFSYDLSDLACYYSAYNTLMQHWRDTLGTRLIEIDYESLVADQEGETRRLLDACGLPWEERCLEFHRNESPTLTASAAQVRQPLYNSSVGLWRHYRRELQPLIERLRDCGVTTVET